LYLRIDTIKLSNPIIKINSNNNSSILIAGRKLKTELKSSNKDKHKSDKKEKTTVKSPEAGNTG